MATTDAMGDDATLVGDEPPRRVEEVIAQGAAIGRYVVLGRLGAGGMGVVHAAYDPELDRKVAIKLLLTAPGGSHSTQARTRLMREAQALAKLSHPNVVAVYDVGTVGERVWMAMELVKGQTVAAWLAVRPRPWREVLRVMSAAGEGLAAAHEAGLLHRDFKPDNVMIDASCRVRVMDFGLARAGAGAEGPRTISGMAPRLEPVPLSQRVTVAGSLMGTPGYMSPEQLGGKEVDARSDQFAFAVTLWEALYGRRPFDGLSFPELASRVLAGERERPPASVAVPGWLRRTCERAMATDPEQRFTSMRALADALAQGQRRARQRTVLAAVGALLAVGGSAFGVHRWDRAQQLAACEAEGAVIEEVWNDDVRARVSAGILATGVSHAETTVDKVLPWIDREAAAWAEHRAAACIHATVEQRWSADTVDRARWCLDERRLRIESLVQVLSEADVGVVQRAVTAVAALEPSAACIDEATLARSPPPPAAESRPRVAEVRAELARAKALARLGKPGEGLAVVEGLEDEVATIGWGPLTASTSVQASELLEATGALERAEQVGIAAYLGAAESSAWGEAADVASHLAYLVGYARARPAEGRLWAQHAAMAASFAGDPQGLHESLRATNLAGVALSTGAFDQAQQLYARALALQRAAVGPEHPSVGRLLTNLGVVAWSRGATDEAEQAYAQALAILEQALGPAHPDLAILLGNLGALLYERGDYPGTKALYERAHAIQTAALDPEHPDLAASLDNLALVHNALGDHERALALQQQALARWEQAVDARHPSLALCLGNLATILRALQRPTEAIAALERAVVIYDHHEGVQQYEHEARFGLARLLVETGGDRVRARALAQAARDGFAALGEGKAKAVAEVDAWLAGASRVPSEPIP